MWDFLDFHSNDCCLGIADNVSGLMAGIEDVKGLSDKQKIIISMLSALVVLVIGNLTIIGYCLYSRYEECQMRTKHVLACMRACVCAYVRACVCMCVCACVSVCARVTTQLSVDVTSSAD